MAAHNEERFVRRAITSILEQEYRDFELIVVDDASSDTTPAIVADLASRDPRVRILRNDSQIGAARARNVGIGMASGEYLAIQDADDVALPERLAVQVDHLDAHPDVGAVASAVRRIDPDDRELVEHHHPREHEKLRIRLLFNNFLCHSTLVARTALVRRIGGFDAALPYAQDYDLWWKLSNASRIECLPQILTLYRTGDANAISIAHYRRQQELACSISYGAAIEVTGAADLDRSAYERFWWGYCENEHRLTRENIAALTPLWEAIARDPHAREAFAGRIRSFGYRLLAESPASGLKMLRVAQRCFGAPPSAMRVAKTLVKCAAPAPLTRSWDRIRGN